MASGGAKILSGKAALITGGSRGIGRAVAAAYAQAGAEVFICGRDELGVAAALREIAEAGGSIDGAVGDVGNRADAERLVWTALERFGRVDVLVNNASILGPRQELADYPIGAWEEVLRINLTGIFLITRAILPGMIARHAGSIINVTSGVGRRGKARWGAYAVSKAGLEGFTQVLSDEVREAGIRVNSVNPAATRTGMRAAAYPAEDPQTLPTPEQVVPLFLYLA
ncbi:MAG TPA: SDR family NAD(P)-dependent oxidoreductase, partial [Candidatus Binatia bacterium]|nr:SDR family NAD(P)-dependent oxidoreductase [Candidatus Binatia bacterium]